MKPSMRYSAYTRVEIYQRKGKARSRLAYYVEFTLRVNGGRWRRRSKVPRWVYLELKKQS